MKLNFSNNRELPIAKGILFAFIMITIFVIPVFSFQHLKFFYACSFTGIFFFAAISLKKNRKILLGISIFLSLIIWIITFEQLGSFRNIFRIIEFIFLITLVIGFTREIAFNTSVSGAIF